MADVTIDERVRDFLEENAGTHQASDAATTAVYALLDLHKPEPLGDGRTVCMTCVNAYEENENYPCQTVHTIARHVVPGAVRRG